MSATLLEAEEAVRYESFDSGESLYEIVDGEKVELPEMSMYSNEVALLLHEKLIIHLASNDTGKAQHEILFNLNLPTARNRRPDVSFVSYERWPKNKAFPYRGVARNIVPDLAVEVVSPTDCAEELEDKINEYLRAGIRLIWVIYCKTRSVYVYRSADSIHRLTDADELDGADVLPGFRTAIAGLFPPMEPLLPDSGDA